MAIYSYLNMIGYYLDKQMEGDPRYFYRRYMDDVIVLAKTRWHLRKAVRTVNQHFSQLKIEQVPDKTFIGKISKGFDFLGYQFGKDKLRVSKRTLENHIRRLSRLYEQKKSTHRIGRYFLMIIDNIGFHGLIQAYHRR